MDLLLLPVVLARKAMDFGRELFGGELDVSEVSDLHSKQEAVSQIITLAVLADGEVTEAEADNLRHLFETHPHFTGDADAAVERLRAAAKRASRPESLENTVRVVASDLDREWKDDAFRFVAVLALRGSGFGQSEHGFRAAPSSDPGTLLALFARALDVPVSQSDQMIAWAQRDASSPG